MYETQLVDEYFAGVSKAISKMQNYGIPVQNSKRTG